MSVECLHSARAPGGSLWFWRSPQDYTCSQVAPMTVNSCVRASGWQLFSWWSGNSTQARRSSLFLNQALPSSAPRQKWLAQSHCPRCCETWLFSLWTHKWQGVHEGKSNIMARRDWQTWARPAEVSRCSKIEREEVFDLGRNLRSLRPRAKD